MIIFLFFLDNGIKRLIDFMKSHPSLNLDFLLLSLLDHHYLNKLIVNKTSSPNLIYGIESKNYIFGIENGLVKVDELQINEEKLKVSSYEHEYLICEDLSEHPEVWGEYQLDKGSIIWKIKEFGKLKGNIKKQQRDLKNEESDKGNIENIKQEIKSLIKLLGIFNRKIINFKISIGLHDETKESVTYIRELYDFRSRIKSDDFN